MPVWKDVEPSFRGSSSAIADANQAFANAVKGIGDIGRGIDAEKRYEEEKAQKDLLFAQAQDEYKRKLGERTANDYLREELARGQQVKSGWLTDVANQDKPTVENTQLFGRLGDKGELLTGEVYKDESGKTLDQKEAARRLEAQRTLNFLPDANSMLETREDMYERILGDVRDKELLVTDDMSKGLDTVRTAALTANKDAKTSLESQIAALKKEANRARELGSNAVSDIANAANVTTNSVNTVEGSDARSGKGAFDGTSTKKMNATDYRGLVEGMDIGWWDKRDVNKFVDIAKAYPEDVPFQVVKNAADKAYEDGVIDKDFNLEKAKGYLVDEIDQYKANKQSYENDANKRSVTSTQTIRGSDMTKAANYSAMEKEALSEVAKLQKKLTALDKTPQERQDAEALRLWEEWKGKAGMPLKSASGDAAARTEVPLSNTTIKAPSIKSSTSSTSSKKIPAVSSTDISKQPAVSVLPKKPESASTKKAPTLSQKDVSTKLDSLWDADVNNTLLNRGVAAVGRFATDEQSPRTMTDRTLVKANSVLKDAGVILPKATASENSARLSQYLKNATMSENTREVLGALKHDIDMKANSGYRADVADAQLQAAGTGVVNTVLATTPFLRAGQINRETARRIPVIKDAAKKQIGNSITAAQKRRVAEVVKKNNAERLSSERLSEMLSGGKKPR